MQLYNNVVLTIIATCLIVLIYSAYNSQWQVYVQGGKISVEGRVSVLGPVTVQEKVAIDKPIKAKADSATKSYGKILQAPKSYGKILQAPE